MNVASPLHQLSQLSIADLIGRADALKSTGDTAGAIALYNDWLQLSESEQRFVGFFNLGVLLVEAGDPDQARTAYEQALLLAPQLDQARINLGLLLERRQEFDAALMHWQHVADHWAHGQDSTNACAALNNIGRMQEIRRHYPQAEAALATSLGINKHQPDVIQHWLHLRQKQCAWPVFDESIGLTKNEMLGAASPLAMLAATDQPALQWLSAEKFVARKFPVPQGNLCAGGTSKKDRIRIAYVSGDLCTHAVGLLLPDLIEAHDREQFEIFAFDYSPEDGTAHRQRLRQAFDHFIDIRNLSDEQAAVLIRRCDIDVAFDMHGLSSGARPGIFALRPAPTQIAYLGYIGTTAMPWIDYVLADDVAITSDMEPYFTEQVLRLRSSFLPLPATGLNVPDTAAHEPAATNTTTSITTNKTVLLACFNNVYKITPEMLGIWARALLSTPHAKLQLLDDNPTATANMQQHLHTLGVPMHQIEFMPRCSHAQYQANLAKVDLYLDTYPYNAGSTASDVLRAGTPLLTQMGGTFVSRMAGSMLSHIGFAELATTSASEYERTLTTLIQSPGRLARLGEQIKSSQHEWAALNKSVTGDIERYVAALFENRP